MSFDFAAGQDAVGLQPHLKGDGTNDSSDLVDQYLDDSVVSYMTSFDPEDKCKSGDLKGTIMGSHRNGDSHVADDLLRGNSFGEAETFTSNGLDSSLLNRHPEGNLEYFPSASRFPQTNIGQDNGIPSLNDRLRAQQYQRGIVVAPSPQEFAANFAINTPTPLRPQHPRRFSHLRNEYLPGAGSETSMAGPHSQQVYTSSPSRYTLRPQPGSQPGPTPPQVLQPFQESNLRSSLRQLPGYNTVNQMAQHQQSTYPEPQQYSQHPYSFSSYAGLPYQPMSQQAPATPQYVIGPVV